MQELAAQTVLCSLVIHNQFVKVEEPSGVPLTVGLQGEGRGGRNGGEIHGEVY